MTKEEAKREILFAKRQVMADSYIDKAYDMAIKALEQFAQQWIPCSDRLPEDENKRYWICTDTGYQCQCRWTNVNHIWTELTTDWHWHIMDIPQYSHVVAWRELPEPYEEEQDGKVHY